MLVQFIDVVKRSLRHQSDKVVYSALYNNYIQDSCLLCFETCSLGLHSLVQLKSCVLWYWHIIATYSIPHKTLQWRHNGHDSVSNQQPHDCLLYLLFRRRSKKTSKLRVTGLCVGKSPGSVDFPAQVASNAENVSIWWRHHACNCALFCLGYIIILGFV